MTYQLNQRELRINLETDEFEIIPIRHRINGVRVIGPVDFGWAHYSQAKSIDGIPDVMTWGGGPLAGSRIPGTRRLVFCGYSPQWEGFYISSLGGGAYIMHRVGVDFISIQGRARQDSVLILNHTHGEIECRLEAINPDLIWSGYADREGHPLLGFYALQQAVFDRYGSEYEADWLRVFAVGPASRTTNQGIIGSNQVRKGSILPIDDWAGRGGLGSRLLQHHRIAACIFGGDWEDPDLKDSKEINGYFQQYYGDSMIKVDLGAAEKYRYVPGFMTGGTFGVNMHTADDRLFSFNYSSIYKTDAERYQQHKNFILDHYLRQFNEEIIEERNFAHCGEPCSIACKKYSGLYKKDYEPYESLGPQCGVFDQRAAEELNHWVDAMGIDAIQFGGTVSWIMELIRDRIIPPEDFGLPTMADINFKFTDDPAQFDVVEDSKKNADYACKVGEMILFDPRGEPFRLGIRQAAEQIDSQYGLSTRGERASDRAVFTANGKQGSMTPNQYWVPGMLSPMPMMGKYFVYYGFDYLPPGELGKRCVERMVYELFSENTGVCRFHRKWVEVIVDEIISAHYEFPVDYKSHQFDMVRRIFQASQQEAGPVFWNSERTIDIIWQYLEKWHRIGLNDHSLEVWLSRFRKDKWSAAKQYWLEIQSGIAETIENGAGRIPDQVAPYQAARLDIMQKPNTKDHDQN